MTREVSTARVPAGVHPVSILAMALPLVSAPVPGHANPPRPATPPPHGRFAPPPWDRHSPDWLRLDQRLPPDHLARRIDRAVEQLDLAALFAAYAGTGSPAHRPDLLLKVVLFEVHRGRHSPDQWFRDLREHEPCQWLACGLRPARSRLYAWRDRLGPRLYAWHEQVVRRALERGVTAAERASLDGSTLEANASRHKLLNEAALGTRQARLAPAAGPVGPAPPAPAAAAPGPPPPPAPAAAAPGPPPPPAPPPPAVPPPTPGWLAPTPAGRQ